MSNIFGNLTSDGLEETKDVLGGSFVFETNAYDAIIKLMYAGKSQNSNSQSVTVHLDIDGQEYRETIWITNRDGNNWYADKKDPKKKQPLPGFVTIDHLCLLSTGLPLANQTTEEKTIMLYDFEHKKDMPKNVHVITSVIGLPVTVGITKIKEFVQKKVEGSDPPVYENTDKIRESNQIDKVFHTESKKTTVELRESREASFYEAWVAKNAGKTRDKTANAGAGANSNAARPVQGNAKAATSLFNKG